MATSSFITNKNNLKEKNFIWLFLFTDDFFTISMNHFTVIRPIHQHTLYFFSPVTRDEMKVSKSAHLNKQTEMSTGY